MTARLFLLPFLLLAAAPAGGFAQQEPRPAEKPLDLGGFGGVVQSAGDLRAAAAALEQFGKVLDRIAPVAAEGAENVASRLAEMSREFDPFGFKTSQHTLQRQLEIIERQQEIILELQQREIERLRAELAAAKKAGGVKKPGAAKKPGSGPRKKQPGKPRKQGEAATPRDE